MPQAWIKTQSVNLAAALTTLAIPLTLDKSEELSGNRAWRHLLLGSQSMPTLEELGGYVEGDSESSIQHPASSISAPQARISTGQIKKLIETGELEKADPAHPVLDALRALHNRECLLNWMERDVRYCIARVKPVAGKPPLPRAMLIQGQEPESVKTTQQLFRTSDIKIAAALCVFGVPLIRMEGIKPHIKFILGLIGHPLCVGIPPVNALAMVTAYRSDGSHAPAMPPDDPFRWAMQALINREHILDLMFRGKKKILISKPGSGGLGAIVNEDASNQYMDKVRAHFRIV